MISPRYLSLGFGFDSLDLYFDLGTHGLVDVPAFSCLYGYVGCCYTE